MLAGLRRALTEGRSDFRVIVPTATMVQHLRNQLAREGFVFRPELIVTLSRLVNDLVPEMRQISGPQFHLLVENAVREAGRAEFADVADLPRFHVSLAQTIDQFDTAGGHAATLREILPATPLAPAFLAVWELVEGQMRKRGLVMRSELLVTAAALVENAGLPGIGAIWLDGFAKFSEPEQRLIEGMRRHVEVTVSQPATRPKQAEAILFTGDDLEREVDEITRRLLVEHQNGRRFREIGVVMRTPDAYIPLLQMAFERFGIPARFYFGSPLPEHPVTNYFTSLVDAMLSGWDHELTLRALRLAPVDGVSSAMDKLDFRVREQLPNRGLAELIELADEKQSFRQWLGNFEGLHSWAKLRFTAPQWSAKFQELRSLFWPGKIPDEITWHAAAIYRSQAAALDQFDEAMSAAAETFPEGSAHISLQEFWHAAKAVLRTTSLRVSDQRRDVVHVLSAYEARQWSLGVVFVCGLIEKGFPKRHQQNAFFPDAAARHLQNRGIALRTAAELDQEEGVLFDSSLACATERVFLSYPRSDARGEQNLPSIFLTRVTPRREHYVPVRPGPLAPPKWAPAALIHSSDLLRVLDEKHRTFSISGLESYLQCGFQFFANKTLRLRELPLRPAERLDFLTQGSIVHEVLAKWYLERPPIEALFEDIFHRHCREKRIPAGYRTELLRQQMLKALKIFAADDSWPRAVDTQVEQAFEFVLDNSIAIRGRIDRLERLVDGTGIIIDYKYSRATTTKAKVDDDTKLQGPLYLAALERHFGIKPAAMVYYTIREAGIFGWGSVQHLTRPLEPLTPEWIASALEETRRAAAEIRAGRITAKPANIDPCRYCDFRDLCRYEVAAVMTAAGN